MECVDSGLGVGGEEVVGVGGEGFDEECGAGEGVCEEAGG